MCKCLYCYKELDEGQKDFHPGCARKFFGTADAPLLEYRREDLDALAAQVIQAQTSLTGVQPKLSLNLHKHEGCNRLTIVGLWGDFIFKPQTDAYPELPENEDLTMHMAEAARIKVVPHSLIRLADGSLGYITRRIDRPKKLYQLTPAYDLLNVAIANPNDKEELALTLNGKKSRLKLSDFLKAAATMGIEENVTMQLIASMKNALPAWMDLINNSFLSNDIKEAYLELINKRIEALLR